MEVSNHFYQLSEAEKLLYNGGVNADLIVNGVFTFLGGVVVSCSGVGVSAGVCAMAFGVTSFIAGCVY